MFWTILKLELAFLRRQGTTYLFFAVLFLMAFFTMASDAITLEGGIGVVYKNSPAAIAQLMGVLAAVGQVITTGVVGTAILRDVQLKAHELLFTTRATRLGYLGGRFTGALIGMLAIYSAIPLGTFIGTLMPWVDHDKLQAFSLASYINPFFVLVVPTVIFVSALFFAVGALTRNLFAIYTQGIALLVSWSIAQNILGNLDRLTLAADIDPFGITPLGLLTRYWTVAERNGRQISLTGPLLTNRLIWLAIAGVLIVAAFAMVRLEAEPRKLTLRGWRRRVQPVAARTPSTPATSLQTPAITLHFNLAARWRQLVGQTWFFAVTIVRDPIFLTIAVISVVNVALGAWFTDTQYGTTIWPTTGEMLTSVIGGAYLFVMILTTIYAGELAWRERQLRIAGITDALPVSTGLIMTGKLLGFLAAMIVVECCGVLGTLAVQTIKGYHHYQLALYAHGVLWVGIPIIIELAALAFVVHSLVNSKFVGHVVMIVFFVSTLVFNTLGFQRVIYQYGFPITYVYSDMNRFAQYADALSGIMLYYVLFGMGLLIVAYLFWPRGADETWAARWAAVRARAGTTSTRALAGTTALATVAAGGFVWYNTSVLNPYRSTKDAEHRQAVYEQDYRRYRALETPRVVGVHIRADLVPERRAFAVASVYQIVNKRQRALDTLFASVTNVAFSNAVGGGMNSSHGYHVDSLVWSRPTTLLMADSARGVYLYRLAQPLAPGDTITLAYGGHYSVTGYPNGSPNNDMVENGTFLNQSYFPSITYDDSPELSDDDIRKREHLKPKDRQPSIHDEAARQNSALSDDADWVTFDAEVSTAPDQIAIAPGYLKRDWMENGRRHFAYVMDRPILNFYSIQSARYAVRRDSANGVALEIYYNPGHEYDLDRMIEGSKRGLAYFTTHFSPYQFRQYRIIEFPRYRTFAQSFPNTIPFSEGIGFIARVRDADDDLDWPLFVTAHELAHQWWGHQIIPANQQGASMLIESLAEYSALTIMEQKYGPARAQKFLRYELDRYLRGRSTERKKEMPLMLVENQAYIHYNKGSLAFYALRDYIGEDSLNSALHRFLHDKAFQSPPYTNTAEFLPYIRAVTPDSLQYVIHDLFETITLYDNKATAATAKRRADGQYDVHLTFDAKKLRADSLGGQTEIPIADYIDVGVFGEPSKGNALGKPLAVRKVHVTQPTMTVDFVVPELPMKAGVDPFNKLIDRTPEDNVRAVEVGKS